MGLRVSIAATLLGVGLVLACVAGCGGGLPTEYGKSKGPSGTKGINGFGTLRKGFESNGWKTQDVSRLSDRLRSLDAIVWTPTTHLASENESLRWLHGWLGQRPRTLIYVLTDEGSEAEYWEKARELAPPDQRLEYRRRHARAISRLLTGTLFAPDDEIVVDRLWFKAFNRNDGPPRWSIAVGDEADDSASGSPAGVVAQVPMFQSVDDVQRFEKDSRAVRRELLGETLIADERGRPLAVRILVDPAAAESEMSPDDSSEPDGDDLFGEWIDEDEFGDAGFAGYGFAGQGLGRSEVIVVAGGSLVNNFAILSPQGAELARRLIAESSTRVDGDVPRVGFITSDYAGVPVSESDDGPPIAGGMELLTVWPLSLVTIHLALMGIIACLILLPIFGRPRGLPERPPSDFADHIHAVAAMMHRTGGEDFARERISEYFKRVRGETSGPWVLPESHPPTIAGGAIDPPASDSSTPENVPTDGPAGPIADLAAKPIAQTDAGPSDGVISPEATILTDRDVSPDSEHRPGG